MNYICRIALAAFVGHFAVGGVIAQEAITSNDLLQNLKPKVKTRGLSQSSMSAEDAAFIEAMKHKTRGLTIEERTELNQIVTAAALPAVDLEINFALNSASLEPNAVQLLQKLGTALIAPELASTSFLIAGHTDARGAKDYNQKLSEERAATVRAFLNNNFQIAAERLVVVGYGQEQLKNIANPMADENRRVKIVNLGK